LGFVARVLEFLCSFFASSWHVSVQRTLTKAISKQAILREVILLDP
jgi:hypothetical protein